MLPEIPPNAPSWFVVVVFLMWLAREVLPRIKALKVAAGPSSQPPPGFDWTALSELVKKQVDKEPATKGDLDRLEKKLDELSARFGKHCAEEAA